MRQTYLLIVDDETDTLAYLYEVLTSEGYAVATTPDPRAALRAAAEVQPDLAVIDYRMPGLDGLQLIEELRRVSPDTRTLLFSAYLDPDVIREAVRLGAVQIMDKPSRPEEILAAIRSALARPTPAPSGE